jgi:hypothetical protein
MKNESIQLAMTPKSCVKTARQGPPLEALPTVADWSSAQAAA